MFMRSILTDLVISCLSSRQHKMVDFQEGEELLVLFQVKQHQVVVLIQAYRIDSWRITTQQIIQHNQEQMLVSS